MLRVAAFELPARWGEPESSFADVERLLHDGPATDLVLLPEQSITGYVSPEGAFDLTPFAEAVGGATTARLGAIARAHRVHLVAPLVLREGDALFNAMIVLGPDGGARTTYRKRHPWYVETWATPGRAAVALVDVGGARCAIAICFDLHFLAEESAGELAEADILLFASAWVDDPGTPPSDTRPALLARLAARFEVAVVNANWGEGTPAVDGQGGSSILGARGETIARAPPGRGPHRVDASLRFRELARRA